MIQKKKRRLKHENGLNFIIDGIKSNEEISSYSSIIEFTPEDIVRSGLVKAWVKYLYYNKAA